METQTEPIEKVGSKKVNSSCPKIITEILRYETFEYAEEFLLTEMYYELGNYKEMNQLQLSKCIPKWKKIFLEERNQKQGIYGDLLFLKKYCGDVDRDIKYITTQLTDSWNKKRDFKKPNIKFYKNILRQLSNLLVDSEEYFNSIKIEKEKELNEKMKIHQAIEITCECGGKYSMRNKQKHFATMKHIKYCKPIESIL
jgi:hypothetical protein